MNIDDLRSRVLILAPTGRDAQLIRETLERGGLAASVCPDAERLSGEIERGAGAVIVADEALTFSALKSMSDVIQRQPPWSDLPVIVMSAPGESTPAVVQRLHHLSTLENVTVVERPVRPPTLTSVISAALRARRRQYEVERLLNELTVAEERLRTMIESAQDYAFINFDLQGCVTYWNSGAERLLGYPEAAVLGKHYDLFFTEEDRRAGVPAKELAAAIETGRADSDGWRIRQDGSRFFASGVVTPARDHSGHITGFVKVIRDVTERRTAMERLASQSRALEQSNEDLQRFAYVASHDLQEPLRVIASYSELLIRAHQDHVDERSQQYVRFIVEGIERMRVLIRDLLEFSRLTGGSKRPPEPTDCTAMLALAIQHLRVKVEETGAKITFDRLPLVLAHDSRLLQVFQNLIGNALKYNTGRPEIHVSAQREGDFWRLSVRDNGIGIAPEYHTKVFGLFQRLHSRTEYPGTGIGLAACKRIIEELGGTIWVESAAGEGSTFHFTLPAVQGLAQPAG